jgi:ABC-2 type transport system permease protein
MSAIRRVGAEFTGARKAFLRRRTAVFFTFFFPLIIVVIFGALVQTRPGGGGLFTEPPRYYVAGYLAVVVLFTPLSRVGSEVARHREGNRFEKLATTPLTRLEWLAAQTLVNVAVIGLAGLLLLALVVVLTGADVVLTVASIGALVAFVTVGVALFCGVGALLGSFADSQDGVIAASNSIALPLLFLSETFVPPALLPAWLPTWLSPLTYFSRGVRAVTTSGQAGDAVVPLAVLTVVALVTFVAGAVALPRTD